MSRPTASPASRVLLLPLSKPGAADAQAANPRATVVIPAHNESAVVGRCIRTLLQDAEPGEFAVLVVSNGSTDDTADRAKAAGAEFGHRVSVLEIRTASKIAALRAAEAVAQGTRIFLDADVLLTTSAARRLVEALAVDEPRMALARIEVDTSGSPWAVRQFYRAWAHTGYIQHQGAGSGVFALNEAGARKVGPLPEVINDDGYVARQFGPDERVLCDVSFTSFAAKSTWALVRRRARIVNGNRQLDQLAGHATQSEPAPAGADNRRVGVLAAVWQRQLPASSALVFFAIAAMARGLALWRRWTGGAGRWSMDTTTRVGEK